MEKKKFISHWVPPKGWFKCEINDAKAYAKRRFPILKWAPFYKLSWLLQDALAGITVGLTAIPQGIAYGVVAGLDPEYGLYASFMGSFVYVLFGSCKSITIGPTAIMALIVQPLVVNYGPDVAVFLCFLKGCIIALFSILHFDFLLDFISLPVITGFTSAAAINIASSQFKPLLGITGKSENFANFLGSIFENFHKIRVADLCLGIGTLIGLVVLKNVPGKRTGTTILKIGWMVTLTRNAFAVIIGILIAFIFHTYNMKPFQLTDTMGQGLPPFTAPPFSVTFKNNTYNFIEMTKNMGSTLFTIPIISTIEHMAIAKAFAMGSSLDKTQEMLALGLCNIIGSFVRSMPVTGSFTRTAVNHTSGVRTPLGGIFTGGLVLLAAGLLPNTFRFIPKTTLAAVIICAMYYMLDFQTYLLFWRAKKMDFLTTIVTLFVSVFYSLEMGIAIGVALNLITLLYSSARPSMQIAIERTSTRTIVYVTPEEALAFPAGEKFRANIMKISEECDGNVILDCKNLKRIDVTVAKNIKLLSHDLSLRDKELKVMNSSKNVSQVLKIIAPEVPHSHEDLDLGTYI